MSDEEPKIGWGTYVLAALWAVFLIGMAWAVPPHREMFDEIYNYEGPWRHKRVDLISGERGPSMPYATRVVVGIPVVGWIALGLVVPGALVWKSRLLSRKVGDLVDVMAAAAWVLTSIGVVYALLRPLLVIMESVSASAP